MSNLTDDRNEHITIGFNVKASFYITLSATQPITRESIAENLLAQIDEMDAPAFSENCIDSVQIDCVNDELNPFAALASSSNS